MIRVIILEDQNLLRESLARSLSESAKVSVTGMYADTGALLAAKDVIMNSDVALIDIRLANGTSYLLVEQLKEVAPALRMIWLSSVEEDFFLEKAFAANLPGFVHKDDSLEVLITAIETVANGGQYHSEWVRKLRQKCKTKPDRYSLVLSDREQDVLKLIGAGFSNSDAASLLGLSESTLKTHRRNIMARLGLHSAIELQSYALSTGLVDAKHLRS